ncbi:uncharacterized protein LOC129264895 [Lytechinus pictus]|uniref:uncharacterized protein LOC129264895 n=1 Tax=Lytechinus pictus TaxID=7653 RepID=UPI00240D9062|nr:uncharacterized protein LOC129264895 [Lytechinus pictus]XP_054758831.1 uncharacterized protein LOC129264895 [Lytechinus pictus]
MSSGMKADFTILEHAKGFQKKEDQFLVIELVANEGAQKGKKGNTTYDWKDITDKAKSSRLVGKTHDLMDHDQVKPNFEEFRETYFTDARACLAFYDFSVVKPLVEAKSYKIAAFKWCPDTLQVGKKMVFASSVETLRKDCSVSAHIIPGTDPDELTFEGVLKELEGK